VRRQCELLGLNRTGVYYTPRPAPEEDLKLMRRFDELHLSLPFYGARRLTRELPREGFDAHQHGTARAALDAALLTGTSGSGGELVGACADVDFSGRAWQSSDWWPRRR